MNRYRGDHKAVRRALLPYAVGSICPRCGKPILAGQPVELDHITNPMMFGGGGVRALAHRKCNREHGAELAAASRNARKRRVWTMLRECSVGVAIADDRSRTSIVAAGHVGDVVSVEVAGYLDGSTVGAQAVVQLRAQRTVRAVAIDPHSPGATLIKPLREAGVEVTEPSSTDAAVAYGQFIDLVKSGGLRYVSHPALDTAVRLAMQRPLGGGTAWLSRGVQADMSPLLAATWAVWGLLAVEVLPPADIF